jgi:hypothetical protein
MDSGNLGGYLDLAFLAKCLIPLLIWGFLAAGIYVGINRALSRP